MHIPESRTGNVLRRPVLRDYEIAYLSNAGAASAFVINISDLMVSVKGGKIMQGTGNTQLGRIDGPHSMAQLAGVLHLVFALF